MTLDIANSDPTKQVSIALADPTVVLAGQTVSRTGNLVVTMTGVVANGGQGPGETVPLGEVDNIGATPANSPYTFSYNINSLGAQLSFTAVTATWNSLHVTAPPNFTTLGSYRFSQYNVPVESPNCGGTPAVAFVFRPGSSLFDIYAPDQNGRGGMDSNFIVQTTTNGTGRSASHGLLKAFRATRLFSPVQQCAWPLGSNQDQQSGNVFVSISDVTGSCNTQFTAGGSMATYPNPASDQTGAWNCSDEVMILNSNNSINATMSVQDKCPRCQNFNQIDIFTSSQACSPYSTLDYPNSPLYGIRLR